MAVDIIFSEEVLISSAILAQAEVLNAAVVNWDFLTQRKVAAHRLFKDPRIKSGPIRPA
jgi:hypothetical protein